MQRAAAGRCAGRRRAGQRRRARAGRAPRSAGVSAAGRHIAYRDFHFVIVPPGPADPYLNVDAGTMSPFEHGEVFVLDDGGEVRAALRCACTALHSSAAERRPGASVPVHRRARAGLPAASCRLPCVVACSLQGAGGGGGARTSLLQATLACPGSAQSRQAGEGQRRDWRD